MTKRASRSIAAIDIGSNTVHLLIASGKPGALKHLRSESELLELGRDVMLHGKLTDEKLEEVIDTLKGHVKLARDEGVETILIGATGALRQAKNGKAVVKKIARAIDVPVQLLTGEQEARLAFFGAAPALKKHKTQLLIDSGGASTEVTLARGRRRMASASMGVGAAMLLSQLKNDPPQPLEWAQLTLVVGETLEHVPTHPKPKRAVAIGGAAHRFEEIVKRPASKPLRLKDLEAVTRKLLKHPSKRIAKITGVQPRRAALLAASALILHIVLKHYGLTKLHVAHQGLRDGMIAAYLLHGGSWWREVDLRQP